MKVNEAGYGWTSTHNSVNHLGQAGCYSETGKTLSTIP